jgi:acyl-CoA thioester hydrolase
VDRFVRSRLVTSDDIDELGHVNNVVWVRFVVELAVAHSDSVGLDTAAYRKLGAWWVVHRQEIDYRAPGLPGDELVEETWVAEMRGARSVRRSRFRRAADDVLLVEARTTWVFADVASGRPRRIAPEVKRRFPCVPEREVAA